MQQPTYILDFDSTLVQCESLDELARLSLASHEDRHAIMKDLEHITHRAMAGEIAFDESLKSRLQLFDATHEEIQLLSDYLKKQISPSALATRSWFTTNRSRIHIVSGGFEEYIMPIATQLGIPTGHVHANRFIFQGDTVVGFDTSRYTSKPGGKAAQIAALHLPRPVIAIGDGFTDYEIKSAGLADEFWAYTETVVRPPVTAKADRVIRSFTDVATLTAVKV